MHLIPSRLGDCMLSVEALNIFFPTTRGIVHAVRDLGFTLHAGRTLGIVGESGSGKSQTAFAVMGLLPRTAKVSGRILLEGREIHDLTQRQFNQIRSRQIAMVYQDPMSALNPYLSIETQMTEVLKVHQGWSHSQARAAALHMLDAVKISDAKRRISLLPHEFSGGMRQRVLIAMALLCKPKILIADEPTTALDVTVQAQILQLLRELQTEFSMSLLMISHNLGVVASVCDEVLIMYAGQIMEQGSTETLFKTPQHPYTQGLLRAMPCLTSDEARLYSIPGNPPDPLHRPQGCPFQARCAYVHDTCMASMPSLRSLTQTQRVACFREFSRVE